MTHDALRLTAYAGERDRAGDRFLAEALLDVWAHHGVRSGILLRGATGFGLRHHLRSDRLLTLSEDLPVVAAAVDGRARIEAVAAEIGAIMTKGLVTLEDVRVVDGVLPAGRAGEPTRLTVHLGRTERAAGRPAFVALCALLHDRGIAGATALLGVDGMVAGARARARFLGRNADVPVSVVAVGDAGRIVRVVPEITALLAAPSITAQPVRICKRDGVLVARPPHVDPSDGARQKLTVFTSEQARAAGRPAHAQIVHALRAGGSAGATSLRGIWGFHGAHAPHGDRVLQLRRRVPVVTAVVDTPERIQAAFDVIDRLTPERGLVISETIASATTFAARG